jgi:hypothetical protein
MNVTRHVTQQRLLSAMIALSSAAMTMAQTPAAGKGGPPRPVLSVSSTAWADGGEVPMHNAFRGDNKSPAFEFHWSVGNTPASAPDSLQTYAVIFHDLENSTTKTTDRQRFAGRIGNRRSSRWNSKRSRTCGAWRESGRLLRARRGTGAATSLRFRILCVGYQARLARQHDA